MVLVTPAELAARLARHAVLVLDVQPPADARRCHIAGARHFDLSTVQAAVGPVPDMLLGPDAFARAASAAGIEPSSDVVVYDGQDGRQAARTFWLFERYGHRRVRVLAGGLTAWSTAGFPTESGEPAAAPTTAYAVAGLKDNLAEFEDVQSAARERTMPIVDARSADEFAHGAVPGAVNLDFSEVIAKPPVSEWLRPRAELDTLFQERGVRDPAGPVIVYCRSGARSSVLYLALRSLGYQQVFNYDGSWADWEMRRTTEEPAP